MVGFEAGAPALVEPKCEIPPLWTCLSNRGPSSGPGTEHGGQFDWGGRLLNSNGGLQRLVQSGWKSLVEYNGRPIVTGKPTSRAGAKAGHIIVTGKQIGRAHV